MFADFGWAWNLKPPGEMTGQKWKNRAPSAEFVESFFICLYGGTQSFMEHLGNENGGIWSHKDLEHVSIAIMFFWTGLCGLLIETPFIRRCFNHTIEATFRTQTPNYEFLRSQSTTTINPGVLPPPQQHFSFNPFPGLIIFMTGIMMSMHHQESMLSTMIHKQWGYLLAAFALFRLGTYVLMFLSPPKSYFPSRPVTELLTSFCLICGGIVFMVFPFSFFSSKQTGLKFGYRGCIRQKRRRRNVCFQSCSRSVVPYHGMVHSRHGYKRLGSSSSGVNICTPDLGQSDKSDMRSRSFPFSHAVARTLYRVECFFLSFWVCSVISFVCVDWDPELVFSDGLLDYVSGMRVWSLDTLHI